MIEGLPNPPTHFEQDPDSPDGTGTFHFQDGSSLYAHEPELASAVQQRAQPDQRLADNSDIASWLSSQADKPSPPPVASDVPTRAALMANASDANSHAAPAGPPPVMPNNIGPILSGRGPAQAPAAAPPADPAAAAALHNRLAMGQASAPAGPAAPPRPYVAGRAGGVLPTTVATTQETQGAPYSAEDAGLREQANQTVVGARLAQFDAQRAQAEQQATAAQAAIPALRYQAAEGQAALSKLDDNYKIERARVRTMIEEHDKQAKPDPNRLFHQAGTLGQVAMIIGQALGAYSAVLGHTDNFAQKLVGQALDRDMQAQEDEIKNRHVGDNNLLAKLNDQLGDLDQAKSGLRLIQQDLLDKQIQSFAAASQSAEAARAAGLWLAQNQQARLAEEQKFRDLSIGKQTIKTDAKVITPTAGHRMTDDELIAYQTKQNKARAGLLQSENEMGYQREGGEQADKLARRNAGSQKQIPRGLVPVATAVDSMGALGAKLLDAAGLKRGERPGYLAGQGVGAGMSLDQSRQREFDSVWNTFQAENHKMITGAAPTEGDRQEFEHQTKNWSTAQKVEFIQNALDLAEHKKAYIESQRHPGADAGGGGGETEGGQP